MNTILLVIASASTVCASLYQPFQPVQTAAPIELAKRQGGGCIPNFFSCANQGAVFNGVCCANGQTCGLDSNNSPACCPGGAVCTGTAPASFVTPSPQQTTAVSFVQNPYFSFPFIATYFANREDCSRAVNQCSANNAACTSHLQGLGGGVGGGYAVTIAVPGGGGTTVTAAAGITYDPASATSICSSLSSVACRDLRQTMCTLSATSAGGFIFGSGDSAARPKAAHLGLVGAVAAGVAGLNMLFGF
ncbi:hypothetical protein QBC38DRAFT_14432 [Podospora fimiseda]|uniref:Gpi-anchored protein n=1 Tax=Podospora fimiseda TaxID=252190 RepID=A0AAN7BJU4_9PEZI|nr:hypothetical protein QBC38DRAFT_14432 [Podospora fimiseda]